MSNKIPDGIGTPQIIDFTQPKIITHTHTPVEKELMLTDINLQVEILPFNYSIGGDYSRSTIEKNFRGGNYNLILKISNKKVYSGKVEGSDLPQFIVLELLSHDLLSFLESQNIINYCGCKKEMYPGSICYCFLCSGQCKCFYHKPEHSFDDEPTWDEAREIVAYQVRQRYTFAGEIISYNDKKGFGFIKFDNYKDVYFEKVSFRNKGEIKVGKKVSFQFYEYINSYNGVKGGALRNKAVNIKFI